MAPPTSGTNAGFLQTFEQVLGGPPVTLDESGSINIAGTAGILAGLHVSGGQTVSGGDTILGGASISGGLSLPGLPTVAGGAAGSLYSSGGVININ